MKARLPQGYGKGSNNFNDMLKKAQKMQEDMKLAQEELEQKEFTAASGGGVVTATVSGKKEIISLTIKPEAVDPDDVEMLQDLVISAVNEALRQVEDTSNSEMEKITGGLNLPGLL